MGALRPVPDRAARGGVADEHRAALAAVDQPAGDLARRGEARVLGRDRRMHVQGHVEANRMRPVEKAARVLEVDRRPLPPVPVARRLVVGVDDQYVERHPVGPEAGHEPMEVRLAVALVAREPVAEGLAREQRRGPGQGAKIGEPTDVVGAVGEQVPVAIDPLMVGPLGVPAPALGRERRLGVVEDVPAVARHQPVVELHRAALVVEAAVPAAEVAGGLRTRIGVGGGRRDRRRRRARRRRRRREARAGAAEAVDLQPQVGGVEGAAADPVAQGHPGGADGQDPVLDRGLVGRRLVAPGGHGQGRAVLEPAVGRVLEPDQGRGDHLEARRAVADLGRAGGGGRRGGGDRGERERGSVRRHDLQRPRHPPHAGPYASDAGRPPRGPSGCGAGGRPPPSSRRCARSARPPQRRRRSGGRDR